MLCSQTLFKQTVLYLKLLQIFRSFQTYQHRHIVNFEHLVFEQFEIWTAQAEFGGNALDIEGKTAIKITVLGFTIPWSVNIMTYKLN